MKRSWMIGLVAIAAACGSTTVGTGSTSGTTGGTTTGAGGAGGVTASTSTTGAGGAGGGACSPACDLGLTCCGGACVNLLNDVHNCGMCAHECISDPPFCGSGTCGDPPCDAVMICKGDEFCCGTTCCAGGQLCCEVQGPGPSMGPICADPVDGTCPKGCPACQ